MRILKQLAAAAVCSLLLVAPANAQTLTGEKYDKEEWPSIVDEVLEHVKGNYVRELSPAEILTLREKCLDFEKNAPRMYCLLDLDPHSVLHPPAEARQIGEDRSGSLVGIGAEVTKSTSEPKGILIAGTLEGPAAKSGLLGGDIILEIDGRSTSDMDLMEAVNSLRGENGSPVKLKIWRFGVEPFEKVVIRGKVELKTVSWQMLPRGFGYIKVKSFDESVPRKLVSAIYLLREKNGGPFNGLVLDLRGNPGGLLHIAGIFMNAFLEKWSYPDIHSRVTVSADHRGETTPQLLVNGRYDLMEGRPLLILVDEGSASASEIVAGALQLHGRAVVAGTYSTFGKGTIQGMFPVSRDRVLRLTVGQYFVGPTGCQKAVQGVGVTPDIFLKDSLRQREDATDRNFGPDIQLFRENFRPHALRSGQISNANCRYRFKVSDEHKKKALEMLQVLGLETVK